MIKFSVYLNRLVFVMVGSGSDWSRVICFYADRIYILFFQFGEAHQWMVRRSNSLRRYFKTTTEERKYEQNILIPLTELLSRNKTGKHRAMDLLHVQCASVFVSYVLLKRRLSAVETKYLLAFSSSYISGQ